jgi:hypothetical protein
LGQAEHPAEDEGARHLLPAQETLLQHLAHESGIPEEDEPEIDAEHERRDESEGRRGEGRRKEGAPLPRGEERHRNEKSELRLVGEKPERDAGKRRPLLDRERRDREERRREQRILSVEGADEGARKGKRKKDCFLFLQKPRDRRRIGRERGGDEDEEGGEIGEQRQRRHEQLIGRRIVPEECRFGRRHGEALRLVDLLQIEGVGRMALQRQMAGAPEGDEVVAERLAEGIDERVREKHERQRAHRIGGDEHARIDAHAIGVEQGFAVRLVQGARSDPPVALRESLDRASFEILYQEAGPLRPPRRSTSCTSCPSRRGRDRCARPSRRGADGCP